VKPEMRISCEELFGPAVAVTPFDDLDQAIALANDTNYGLAAAIFTESLEHAMKFAREVQSGNLHVNWGPQWRADLMPYGGLKESGFGKEGPKYAIQEMTEVKTVDLKSYTLGDIDVVMIDKDAAMLTYSVTIEATEAGKDASGKMNAASIWKKEGNDWRCVFHSDMKAE